MPSPNRLAREASPYLLLHATNPVDWYPWGEEAFALAHTQDKPIFLSIGYYTCHWCHVMERESFADASIAALLNRDFVAIKVDREERPDVDRLYMAFVQATTGGGGWPLSAFLTPSLQPFYGGTYFPPRDRHGLPSFARVLQSLAEAWRDQRERLLASAHQASDFLAQATQPPPLPTDHPSPEALRADVWPRLGDYFSANYDAAEGGFGSAPKFPRPAAHTFLLRSAQHPACAAPSPATAMVVHTLRALARGGIHDPLGGGFHRYATDAGWRVPHFEKMLYDQAQLAVSYLEAWQVTQAPDLAAAARSTCDFVLRELTRPPVDGKAGGGFYSAQDADSLIPDHHRLPGGPTEGEGAYYLWIQSEIAALLAPDLAELFCFRYGVLAYGNVPRSLDPQGEFEGKNILYGAATLEEAAAQFHLSPADATAHLEAARRQLYTARRRRPHPPTDDKILAAWNGLMISALAQAASALDEPTYLAAAQAAARFLEANLWDPTSRLLYRRDRRSEEAAPIPGFVEDYACLIQALLDLHQADFDPHWMDWAHRLQQRQEDLFAAPAGGYYSSGADPHLWLRLREEYDGAEPSPNSVAVSNLLRLDLWYPTEGLRQRAEQTLASFAPRLRETPAALPLMASTLAVAAAPPRRLQIAGDGAAPDTRALLRTARRRFLPGYSIILTPPATATAPAAAYLCDDFTCQLPLTNPAALAAALDA